MATDEELLVMFSQPGTTRREALRAVYNAGLSRAADIARVRWDANFETEQGMRVARYAGERVAAAIEAERDQA